MAAKHTSVAQSPIKRWPFIVAAIAGMVGFFVIVVIGLVAEPNGAGEYGDYVGGVGNPLLAFLAFVALLYTIYIQQTELRLSRKELEFSREELELTREELSRSASALEKQAENLDQQQLSRMFFDLFSMYQSVVSSMRRGTKENPLVGKAAIENYANSFQPFSWDTESSYSIEGVKNTHRLQNDEIGNFFRIIYRIYAFLTQYGQPAEIYADMFRAQLSTSELHLLFFNCISDVGRPMMTLAAEYELFDNMPIPSGQGLDNLLGVFDVRAFGKNTEILKLITQK